MRNLKLSVLGLALCAGACGVAEPSGSTPASNAPRTPDSVSTSDDPPPVIDVELLPQKKEPAPAPPKVSKAEAIKRDLQRLQGRWAALDIEHDGGKERPQGGLRWVFRDDQYEVWIGNQKLETNQVTLDPTQEPKTIEMRNVASGSKGPRIKGIYALEGGTLKVCYDISGQGYPEEFSAPKGARRIAYVFRRE